MAVVYAISTTNTARDGLIFRLAEGEVWDADDPLVKAHPDLFSKEPTKVRRSAPRVERATAAPGERRNTSKPKSK